MIAAAAALMEASMRVLAIIALAFLPTAALAYTELALTPSIKPFGNAVAVSFPLVALGFTY